MAYFVGRCLYYKTAGLELMEPRRLDKKALYFDSQSKVIGVMFYGAIPEFGNRNLDRQSKACQR
ncbi:uncharacterized protein PGTG_22429 [Puccinia graminis f. sp. tritici CRL 75-36-700-3]|uniref:Uncharacterized protein n=1 Tax=Puccinia graminis f. sp. tritici (strain CRL 75-36-700-3 / race SCCL) TaxID=418459 RepID=H6QUJ9_PUCGT|nr:uncharacterized protein PGTG_22429 [Puccinia graminis f. sp. tritici CRL 75-36-700-3]EHS64711.1 hypothetical protein PGTG_22429 [Puccinia graminis f. sp. tritici CRL 75-36-700-3]